MVSDIKEIHGWFNYSDLYDEIILKMPNNSIFVEVGVWKGKSVLYAAQEITKSGKDIKIIAVDTWEGTQNQEELLNDPAVVNKTLYNEFLLNTKKYKKIITPMKMTSVEAAGHFEDKSLDFVFLDGDHRYLEVKADIIAWLPKIKPGGHIGGHDYGNGDQPDGGVKKAVDEFFKKVTIFNPQWASWLKRI